MQPESKHLSYLKVVKVKPKFGLYLEETVRDLIRLAEECDGRAEQDFQKFYVIGEQPPLPEPVQELFAANRGIAIIRSTEWPMV